MTSAPPTRYPDLTGKAVIVVGTTSLIPVIVAQLAANSMLIAVIASDRELVTASVAVAEALGAVVNGFTVDPADAAVWERIRPHIEQRLGPIDVAICEGPDSLRAAVIDSVLPDMVARKRGVIIEVAPAATIEPFQSGVRHYGLWSVPDNEDLARYIASYASDTMEESTGNHLLKTAAGPRPDPG